jgi:signal transduction histidine kinase
MTAGVRSLLVVGAAIAADLLFWDGETELAGGRQLNWWLPVLLTAAVHLTLAWRRTHPLPVFATQAVFAMVSLLVPLWQPVAGLLIATFAVAANLPAAAARWGWLASVPLLVHALVLADSAENEPVALVQAAALYLAAGAAVWVAGRRGHARRERLRAWQADQERLRVEATHNERVALARELHDGVANTITAVLVQAAAARATAGDDPAALRGIEASARRAMEEIQATLRLMPRHRMAAPTPLLEDLPALLALATEAGLEVSFAELGSRRTLPPVAQTAAYRAIQEGITNTLKYAPTGTRCRITLTWRASELRIDIVDSAAGVAGAPPRLPATGGRGLEGLQDRLRTIGGELESGAHEHGYRLAARVPVGVR